mgnify:FL=1
MNISKISFAGHIGTANFKGQPKTIKENSSETLQTGFELPNATQYDYSPLFTDPRKGASLQEEYRAKLTDICFDKKGELNPVIKKKLDDSHFVFEQPDGTQKVMTIKEALKSYVKSSRPIDTSLIHATFVREDAMNIAKNGFDPKRIKRTEFGPGFYFSPSEGDAMNYGSAKVKARIKGNCAHMDGKFYEKINNYKTKEAVKKFVGLNSTGYPTQEIENSVANLVINEYARNVLYNEMGYDCAYGSGGGKSCFVVFNPDSISDIEMF